MLGRVFTVIKKKKKKKKVGISRWNLDGQYRYSSFPISFQCAHIYLAMARINIYFFNLYFISLSLSLSLSLSFIGGLNLCWLL